MTADRRRDAAAAAEQTHMSRAGCGSAHRAWRCSTCRRTRRAALAAPVLFASLHEAGAAPARGGGAFDAAQPMWSTPVVAHSHAARHLASYFNISDIVQPGAGTLQRAIDFAKDGDELVHELRDGGVRRLPAAGDRRRRRRLEAEERDGALRDALAPARTRPSPPSPPIPPFPPNMAPLPPPPAPPWPPPPPPSPPPPSSPFYYAASTAWIGFTGVALIALCCIAICCWRNWGKCCCQGRQRPSPIVRSYHQSPAPTQPGQMAVAPAVQMATAMPAVASSKSDPAEQMGTPIAAAAASSSDRSTAEQLRELKELLDEGFITEAEFESKKQATLARI